MSRVNDILKQFGEQVTKLAKANVSDSTNPNGGKKIDASGSLKKSIKYNIEDYGLSIEMQDYGVLRDSGQLGKNRKILKGWNKSLFIPRGKGFTTKPPKIAPLMQWVRTKSGLPKGMNPWAVRENIWKKGIQPGLFLSDAFNQEFKELDDEIIQAYSEEIEERLE